MTYEPDRKQLAKKALTQALLSIGISDGQASDIIKGTKKPSLDRAVEIEERIGIPASAWAKHTHLDEMWKIIAERAK